MDIAREIIRVLEAGGFGTFGTDLFVSQIPEDQNGIYVTRLGGNLNDYVPIETSVLNIYVKNTNSQTAITTIENVKRFIHRLYTTSTPSTAIYSILGVGDIEDMSRDLEYANQYKLTISVMHRDKSVIS